MRNHSCASCVVDSSYYETRLNLSRSTRKNKLLLLSATFLYFILGFAQAAAANHHSGYVAAVGGNIPPKGAQPFYVTCPYNFYKGECTSYVAYRLNQRGIRFHNQYNGQHFSNANTWPQAAQRAHIPVDKNPQTGDAAVFYLKGTKWESTGHVAYVESVNNDGTINVSEYNRNGDHQYTPQRKLNRASADWYIHFENSAALYVQTPQRGQQFNKPAASFGEGALIRHRGKPEVYMIQMGRKCHIPDPETFEAKGCRWDTVRDVDQATFDSIPMGSPFRSVKTIAKPSQPPLTSSQATQTQGRPPATTGNLPVAHFGEGALIRLRGTPDVYVIKGGRKCRIPDPETFNARGYRWDQVADVDHSVFNSVQMGSALSSARTSGKPNVPNTGYNPPRKVDSYCVRISNIDDKGTCKVNGKEVASVAYYQDTQWIDITKHLRSGKNEIKFTVEERGGGYAYHFGVQKNGKTIWEERCGEVGKKGCTKKKLGKGDKLSKTCEINI